MLKYINVVGNSIVHAEVHTHVVGNFLHVEQNILPLSDDILFTGIVFIYVILF